MSFCTSSIMVLKLLPRCPISSSCRPSNRTPRSPASAFFISARSAMTGRAIEEVKNTEARNARNTVTPAMMME